MGKPWLSLSEQQLDDLCLDDESDSEGQQESTSRPQCLFGPVHEILLVVIAAFTGASFLLLQRTTMVLTDTVRHSLLLDMSEVSWMSAGSGLTGAIFLLPIARVVDCFPDISRKAFLISATMLFSLTMGLTALTTNGIVLDIMLGISGLACAAHFPIMSSLLTSIYAHPSTRRHCVLTLFLAGGNAFSIIFGSVGSGLVDMATNGDWRGSFVYIAVLYAIVAIVGIFVIPNIPRTYSTTAIKSNPENRYTLLGHAVVERKSWTNWWSVLKSIDYIGLLIIFAGVACLSAGLSRGPEGNWRDAWVFLPLACSVGCFIGFFTWEGYTGEPVIPRSVLECPSLILTLISTFCISLAFFPSLFWVSFFMQDLQQLSSVEVGARQLPQAVTGLIFSPIVGCWMHKIDNMFIMVAAALCQAAAGALLLFLHPSSNYFACILPSLILSALGMDWARNVGAQYIEQTLSFEDQIVGTAVLQLINRLAIPLGIGITSAIWSSCFPATGNTITNLHTGPVTDVQVSYFYVFIATICFAAVAVVVASFSRLGKLGVASTATDPSLPHVDTGLKSINLDGGGDRKYLVNKGNPGPQIITLMSLKFQPRNYSLLGGTFNDLRRTSTGAASFHLPRIGDPQASGDASELDLGFGISDDGDSRSQRKSTTAMTERVIWLVCEDCGESKRIVEPVGDPERYFYDTKADEDVRAKMGVRDETLTPPTPLFKSSSVYREQEAGVAEVGVVVDHRRFALVNRPGPKLGPFAVEDKK
ncbi:hypothetical protein N0V93_000823 [Gnomoniopsis smithogilvyi]|uniref:Major facilitator superfamily (MFS) profile domain-containing protein n=1 Tax=Gnomoniopsis smithogilvyi TaxID=1191159 RepID=A0A9W9D0L4_9PEZI|nr:hypothetical protein N0V93_000823 [Gnomoniopsis smithogilvyi]